MIKTCKRILSVVLTLCLCFGGSTNAMIAASTDEVKIYQIDYPRNSNGSFDDNRNNKHWGHGYLYFMNEWIAEKTPYLSTYAVGGYNGKVAYCLEPGTFGSNRPADEDPNDQYSHRIGMVPPNEYFGKILTTAHNNGLNPKNAQRFIETIIANGYNGNASVAWNSGDDNDNRLMGQMLATKLLIWQVIVGERDDNFNYTPPTSASGKNKVLDCLDLESPVYDSTISAYNYIENQVKASFTLPSFCKESDVNLKAIDMAMDYENSCFKLTLTDETNSLSSCSFSCDQPSVKFTQSGDNTLVVTAPVTLIGKFKIKVTRTYNTSEIFIYSDKRHQKDEKKSLQDVVVFGNVTQKTTTGWFMVNIPHIHYFIPYMTPPTCTMEGRTVWICRCGLKMTTNPATGLDETKPATGHDYENSPWVVQRPATCAEAGEEVQLCHKCGQPILTRVIDPIDHHGVWYVDSEATADHDGVMAKICTVCGRTLETKPFPLHTHTEGYRSVLTPATCAAAGQEGIFCADCGVCYATAALPALGHMPEANCIHVTAKTATCTENGEESLVCTRCGEVVSAVTLPKTEHDAGVWLLDYDATPEHDGRKTRYCTRCGEALESETFGIHSHTEGHRIVSQAATCTQAGEESIFCADCGVCYATAVLPALGHTPETDCIHVTAKTATCTENGEESLVCTRCGEVVSTETIPALGHDEGVPVIAVAADCTHVGEETLVCTRCGETVETRQIAALGHSAAVFHTTRKATCETAGEEVSTCERCGVVIETREIPARGHDEGVWTVVQEATSEHDGLMVRSCSRCGQQLESRRFAAHTHTFGYEAVVQPAACTEAGTLGRFCATCGVMYASDPIPALGHSYSDWSTNQNGTHSRTCGNCHDVQTETCIYTETVTAPTCTAHGFTTETCTICGDTKTGSLTAPLGHALGDWIADENGVTHSAACTRDGCDYHETQRHGDVETVEHEEGLFSQAIIRHTCPDCGFTRTVTLPRSPFFQRLFRFFGYLFRRMISPFRNF